MKEEAILRGGSGWLRVSRERAATVIEDVTLGSDPKFSFYALLVTSSLIAAFGLIANSTAVVIGAMLVSPLMTPILGIALGLVRGDGSLLRRAVLAEGAGVILAVGVAALFGMLPLNVQATPEMLARTEPNLLDLIVAVLAGFAGTYAVIDERISPALPGVAIATAIVPPLSNCGLCLALGAYEGASGSILLFLANFLSILLVASILFFTAGLAPRFESRTMWNLVRRFGWAVLGFVLVGVLLTGSLVRIVKDRQLDRSIRGILTEEFSEIHAASLDKVVYEEEEGTLYILATARSPALIKPGEVKTIQDSLTAQVGASVELVVRNVLAKDVTARGSTRQVTARNLDGEFLRQEASPRHLKERNAEQVMWEELGSRPGLELINVTYGQAPAGPMVMAHVHGFRPLNSEELRHLEETIQARLDDPTIHLMVRFTQSTLLSHRGEVLFGWSTAGGELTSEKEAISHEIETALRAELAKYPDVFFLHHYVNLREDRWRIMAEVAGRGKFSSGDLKEVEEAVSKRVGLGLRLFVWTRDDTVVTETGVVSFKEFMEDEIPKWEEYVFENWYAD
jgi:uncharacterized hydrophobic protein (TIGR00271 family)